jgi:CHAT domain-containing protein
LKKGLDVILKKSQFKSTKIEILQNLIKAGRLSNNPSNNLTYCIQADSLIDLMRQEHTEQGSKLFWREKTHTFYENAIETCYQLKDYNKAFYFMEKSRAILLLDGLKDLDAKKILSADKQNQEQNLRYKIIGLQKKLGNTHETDKSYTKIYQQLLNTKEEYNSFVKSLEKTNSAYYQLKYNNQYISLSSLQAALKLSNQSFIEYFVGENTVYAFVATAKDARLIKINLQKYNSLSKQFLSLTAQKPPHTATQLNNFCLVANKLYQLIYAPLNIPVGRVIISQDNYFLPFGALVADVERQKFLVEDYSFSYTYSANILFREKEKQLSFNKNLLGFSPIHYNNSLNLNTLSGSDQVLNSIEDKYFSGKVLLEKQATKQNFIQNAPNYTIIQLFTHGKADTVSDKSKIYFYDDALNMSELYQLEKLKAELVVLSACETNLGSNATGEGIMSFARGFAYLGVPSTVSTLWSVNNQSTYQLTEIFYKYLDDGYEKDIALQMAQKEYLKNSGYGFPYYWSGVVLVGDASSVSVFFFSLLPYLLFVLVLLGIFYFFKKKST